MVIVPGPGDPLNDEIHGKIMFSRVFSYLEKNPGLGKQVDQAWVNRQTRPGSTGRLGQGKQVDRAWVNKLAILTSFLNFNMLIVNISARSSRWTHPFASICQD